MPSRYLLVCVVAFISLIGVIPLVSFVGMETLISDDECRSKSFLRIQLTGLDVSITFGEGDMGQREDEVTYQCWEPE